VIASAVRVVVPVVVVSDSVFVEVKVVVSVVSSTVVSVKVVVIVEMVVSVVSTAETSVDVVVVVEVTVWLGIPSSDEQYGVPDGATLKARTTSVRNVHSRSPAPRRSLTVGVAAAAESSRREMNVRICACGRL
jgi:hypothetical protein